MSDALFHFVFPFLAIMATGLKIKHRIAVAFTLAMFAVLLDVDHLFGMLARGTLHNVFVTLLLPFSLFLIALNFERKGTFWKTVTLMAALVLFSHPMIDMFVGQAGVHIIYPFSDQMYLFNFIRIPLTLADGTVASIISSEGIGMSMFVLFAFGVIFVEDFVKMLPKAKGTEMALVETIEKEERNIERQL
ncbi:hypothetical protein EPN87_00270 [archaeon]|nr:MAG: hypothetical protein EPN87_00270 [archaeon]